MGKRKCISINIKINIISLYKEHLNQNEIAKKLNFSQPMASRANSKFKKDGNCVSKRSYKKRNRKTTVRSDRKLRKIVNDGRFNNLAEITNEWKNASGVNVLTRTTLRRLNEMGYHCRVPKT
jgi:transposase